MIEDTFMEINGGINCFACVNSEERNEPCDTCMKIGNFALFDRRGSRYGSLKM